MTELINTNDKVRPLASGLNNLATLPKGESTLGWIIGNVAKGTAEGQTRFQCVAMDVDQPQGTAIAIDTPFLGHGIAFDPRMPYKAALFEKRGPGACLIDFQTGSVQTIISTYKNRHFYGHGCFSPDGAYLYSVETVLDDNHNGLISIRETETFREIGQFPSYGLRPHDCHLLPDNSTLVVTNGGGMFNEREKGNVSFIDINTQKLIRQHVIENKKHNAGHVAIDRQGDIAVVSAPREGLGTEKQNGGIAMGGASRTLSGGFAPRKVLDALVGETLSVCIHEHSGTVAAMTPDAGLITFWNIKDGKLIKKLKTSHPRGVIVSHDQNYFIVNHGRPEPQISLVSTDSLEWVGDAHTFIDITGSHIFSTPF